MLTGNAFSPTKGLIEGDHLQQVASIGVHRLVERVNHGMLGGERPLSDGDLPGKVRDAIGKADRLFEQLLKCESIPVATAVDYIRAQGKIAADVLPILVDTLNRQEAAAKEAIATLRKTMIGKGDHLVATAANTLLMSVNIEAAVEGDAQIPAWRRSFALCRDVGDGKTVPRWLRICMAAHEAERNKAAAVG
jgi:hypothetical protein